MRQKLLTLASVIILTLGVPSARAQWVQTKEPYSEITALAASGTNIYAAFFEGGVASSTDNGTSWTVATVGGQNNIATLMTTGTYILAAAADDPFPNVYISTDSGGSWEPDDWAFQGVSIDAFATLGTEIFAGGTGVYLMKDSSVGDGFAWIQPDSGAAPSLIEAMASSGSNLYAYAADYSGFYFSSDSGKQWTDEQNELLNIGRVHALAAFGMNVIAGTDSGLYYSTNNGVSWNLSDSSLSVHELGTGYVGSLVVSGKNVFAATQYGVVYLSSDSGASWISITSGTEAGGFQLATNGVYLFAGGDGVWRRPLSDFANSAVSPLAPIENSLTSYPNPFTQSTTITLTTPTSGVAELSVVNVLGEEVAHLYDGELGAGEHSFMWDKPPGLSPGTYWCVMRSNGLTQELPMILSR